MAEITLEQFDKYRKERGLSHSALAQICGVKEQTVVSWGRRNKIPAMFNLVLHEKKRAEELLKVVD